MITSKRQWYDLWKLGLYWNKPQTWDTFNEYLRADFPGLVALRCITRIGGPFIPNLRFADMARTLTWLKRKGYSENEFQISEMANTPERHSTINAFVTGCPMWPFMDYNIGDRLVREAQPLFKEAWGLQAKLILQGFLWPDDYDNLMWTLDNYPGHVVEITAYDKCLGIWPRSRMITWEVRRY